MWPNKHTLTIPVATLIPNICVHGSNLTGSISLSVFLVAVRSLFSCKS